MPFGKSILPFLQKFDKTHNIGKYGGQELGMAMRIFLAMRIDSDMSDIIAPHFSDRQPFRIRMAIPNVQ